MISNLAQILDFERKQLRGNVVHKSGRANTLDAEMRSCRSPDGHVLSYAVYGDPNGKPVLSLQPTIPPDMTERFRQAAHDAGLRFIAPFKPGSGQTSSRNYSYTPEKAAKDYKAILDAEGIESTKLVGLCAGGVFALMFAKIYPKSVETITLVDTGAPLRSRRDFLDMSSTARRTFLPARYFPALLLSPHKMVAKEFHKSDEGQKRIVNYFVESSPTDLEKVRTQREYYDIVSRIIGYSFEDIQQLVDTVCLWSKNWEPLLLEVCTAKRVSFVHGEKNDMFLWSKVKGFAQDHPNVEAVCIPEESQLGVFVNPGVLLQTLSA